jgi:hypothetical protein
MHSAIRQRLHEWYTRHHCFSIAISMACLNCLLLGCFTWSSSPSWQSDDAMLYTKPYALASYLSMVGLEGIAQSHLFVECANKLALSWIRHVPSSERMEYDMVLIVTDPYGLLHTKARNSLRAVGWILIKVNPLYGIPSAPAYVLQNRYTHTAQFTKLCLWTFEQYKNILYLDSDMLIMRDIVRVISAYNTSVNTLAAARNAEGMDYFNAGLLYITPSKTEFNQMMQAALHMNYDTELQEQAFLNMYWQNRTMFMPKELNVFVDKHPIAGVIVLHFGGNNKPWAVCSTLKKFKKACGAWYSYDAGALARDGR